jgi:hypothetical protein
MRLRTSHLGTSLGRTKTTHTMLSRASALAIANSYSKRFTSKSSSSRSEPDKVHRDQVYDFLFANEYEAWFCNLAKSQMHVRAFKEFWMRIHTGESLTASTQSWSPEQRSKLGQRLLRDLARDHLRFLEQAKEFPYFGKNFIAEYQELLRRLELDGYVYRDRELYQQQSDLVDVEAERNILKALYEKARLQRTPDAFEFLRLGEEHFISERWSDCISNVRKFFELTLQEGARSLSQAKGSTFSEASLGRPVEVRAFLEGEGLLEKKERELVDKLYGLLSETGAHPYMAESDQARLLRQMSLTLAQFVLLRLTAAL